jgi:hypothetical protein
MKIKLSPTIRFEYESRDVFNGGEWPVVPDANVVDVPEATVRAMMDDAHHNGVCKWGPDMMPRGTKLAYAALYAQCKKALAATKEA